MVFVLKPPVDDSKGIIIFTHKERAFLDPNLPFVKDYLKQLKERYVAGMHWGAFQENEIPLESMEFHMSGSGTVVWKEKPTVPHYHLCSRNFLSPIFQVLPNIEKKWDVLTVTNFRRLKNTRQLFQVLKRLLKVRPETTALIICTCTSKQDLNPAIDYLEMEQDYQEIFTPEEQQQIELVVKEGKYGLPFSQEELVQFYNQSRVFTLFSDVEGESRVISEASLCGLPVVVKSWLKGGGLDYLTPENSRQFDQLDDAHTTFKDVLDNLGSYCYDTDQLKQSLCETHSSIKLKALMIELFESKQLSFKGDCDLVGLASKLPGHIYLTLPKVWRFQNSNDLNSPVSAIQYFADLTGQEVSVDQIMTLKLVWAFKKIQKETRIFLKKPGRKLREWHILPPKRKPVLLNLS